MRLRLLFVTIAHPLTSPLFPYTTLFRSTARMRRTHESRKRGLSYRPRIQHGPRDRKSTRLNSSHTVKSYAVFCLKKKSLIQLTKLGYDATPFNQILKQNAKREMRLRLGK